MASPLVGQKILASKQISAEILISILLILFSACTYCGGSLSFVNFKNELVLKNGEHNYAVKSFYFQDKDWEFLIVNGQSVEVIHPGSCTIEKVSLTKDEQLLINTVLGNLLENPAANRIETYTDAMQSHNYQSSSSYSTSFGAGQTSSGINGISESNGNLLISGPNMPNSDWSNILIRGDIVGIVNKDGRVEMTRRQCLPEDQANAIETLKIETEEQNKRRSMEIASNIHMTMSQLQNVLKNALAPLRNMFSGQYFGY